MVLRIDLFFKGLFAVIRKSRITAADGKIYNTNHYNLRAIIAVGSLITNMSIILVRSYFLIVLIN